MPKTDEKPKQFRVRNACITYFGDEVPPPPEGVKYAVYQREKCPETEKLHWQMYAEFDRPVGTKFVQKWLPAAHIEARRGTQAQAIAYCKKDESRVEGEEPIEFGEKASQGERSDLEECLRMVVEDSKKKNPVKRALQTHMVTMIRYKKHITEAAQEIIEPRNYKPTVKVYYGPTGTGKTYTAMQELPDAYVWCPDHGKWWGSYFAQENVIMEEFRGQLPLGTMLGLLDCYEKTVEVKNGFRQFRGRNIIITSPKHPKDWYQDDGSDKVSQLLDRIDEIKYFGGESKRKKNIAAPVEKEKESVVFEDHADPLKLGLM